MYRHLLFKWTCCLQLPCTGFFFFKGQKEIKCHLNETISFLPCSLPLLKINFRTQGSCIEPALMSFQDCVQGCGHSGSNNFEKMTRLHPNNNRIPLFMLETPTAFCVSSDSPRRRNCLTSLLLNNLIKQKKTCQFLPTSQKQSCGGKKGRPN